MEACCGSRDAFWLGVRLGLANGSADTLFLGLLGCASSRILFATDDFIVLEFGHRNIMALLQIVALHFHSKLIDFSLTLAIGA